MDSCSPLSWRLVLLDRLKVAAAAGDEAAFDAIIDEVAQARHCAVFDGITTVSRTLGGALARFDADSRVAALALREVPDARHRLDHVLAMTEQAAHHTLDLIEQSVPLAGSAQLRENLEQMMLAQGVQDLSGQILKGVRTLIIEVESVLEELVRITGAQALEEPGQGDDIRPSGPAIPGLTRNAVASQDDVDELIAGLGI